MGREDQYLAANVQGAVLLNRYAQDYSALRGVSCPKHYNCSWDIFPTLGLCNRCAKLSDSDWETTCGRGSTDCSYTINGMAHFEIRTPNAIGFSALMFESQEVSYEVSKHWFNVSNPLLTIASLSLKGNGKDNYDYYPPTNVTVCTIYPCVRKIDSKYVEGRSDIGIFDSWRNESAQAAADDAPQGVPDRLPDIYMEPSAEELGLDETTFQRQTYFIPGPVADLLRTTLRSTLLVRVWDANDTYEHWNFTYAGYGNSHIGAYNLAHVKPSLEQLLDTVALAVTYYIRTTYENRKYLVTGYITKRFPIINVRWGWIAFPVSLYGLVVAVFGFTVWKTRHIPAWKNSVLPFLFTFRLREQDAQLEGLGERLMAQKAKAISMELISGER